MEASSAIELITGLITEAEAVQSDPNRFDAWQRTCRTVLDRVFGKESTHSRDLMNVDFNYYGISTIGDDRPYIQAFRSGLTRSQELLRSCIWEIEQFGVPSAFAPANSAHAIAAIEVICNHFHAIARQIRQRYAGRPTLDVDDEYDVQDLLHALLRPHFDDIRPEEWTPSYAARSARVDFLLKPEQIVIEVKKTRKGLDATKLGEELIIDIARYQSHTDCKTLVCFAYDPEHRIANPTGLENDLSRTGESFSVKVVIAPKT